jgi:hypothetical protein
MRSTLIAAAIAIFLTGCAAVRQKEVIAKFDSYLGRPVSDLALALGPPTTQFDAGGGKMAFQWEHVIQGETAGAATGVGGTMIFNPLHPYERECRVSVVAATTIPNPSLGDWIIQHWEYHGNDCI